MKPSLLKVVASFALGGGLGVPVVFVLVWQLVSREAQGEAFLDVMLWFEALRAMFWPSAVLLIPRPANQEMQHLIDLAIAVACNIGIYALIGYCVGEARHRRTVQIVLVLAVVAVMYGINMYWSQHLPSFAIAAGAVIASLVLFFRTGEQTTRNSGDLRRSSSSSTPAR